MSNLEIKYTLCYKKEVSLKFIFYQIDLSSIRHGSFDNILGVNNFDVQLRDQMKLSYFLLHEVSPQFLYYQIDLSSIRLNSFYHIV